MAVASEQAELGSPKVECGEPPEREGSGEGANIYCSFYGHLHLGDVILPVAQAKVLRDVPNSSFIAHVSSISKFCCHCLQNTFRIQPFFTTLTSAILVQATSVFLLDHCDSFLTRLPASSLASLHVQATKVSLSKENSDHVTFLLKPCGSSKMLNIELLHNGAILLLLLVTQNICPHKNVHECS